MLDFFCYQRYWIFKSTNCVKLWSELSDRDRETFFFNVKEIDWKSYSEAYILGTRKYILKENIDTLPQAHKKAFR